MSKKELYISIDYNGCDVKNEWTVIYFLNKVEKLRKIIWIKYMKHMSGLINFVPSIIASHLHFKMWISSCWILYK